MKIKLNLVLTIREIDIKDAYKNFDALEGNEKGRSVNGQRAYMMLRGGGHPADYYPCKVKIADERKGNEDVNGYCNILLPET